MWSGVRRHCTDKSLDPLQPDEGTLASWLLVKHGRSRTVARQLCWAVLWVTRHKRLLLPTSELLDPLRRIRPGHVPRQPWAYPLRALAHFDQLSQSIYICVPRLPAPLHIAPLIKLPAAQCHL